MCMRPCLFAQILGELSTCALDYLPAIEVFRQSESTLIPMRAWDARLFEVKSRQIVAGFWAESRWTPVTPDIEDEGSEPPTLRMMELQLDPSDSGGDSFDCPLAPVTPEEVRSLRKAPYKIREDDEGFVYLD